MIVGKGEFFPGKAGVQIPFMHSQLIENRRGRFKTRIRGAQLDIVVFVGACTRLCFKADARDASTGGIR